MIINVEKSKIDGSINAIPSKSYAHRISICNFLSGKDGKADCGDFISKDIEVTAKCLSALKNGQRVLDCGESGSTLRFMIPLCASIGGKFEFVCHGRLINRPNDELFSVLNKHGITTVQGKTIVIDGKLTGGEFCLRGDISSQYISGLLMALPSLNEDSQITLTTPLASKPYVDITLEVLKEYGVSVVETQNGFIIKGGQKFNGHLLPEGDWSYASAFLVLGAICGRVKVNGLNVNSSQGDKKILQVLEDAGCEFNVDQNGVETIKSDLRSFVFDAEDCPDLVPVVSVLGAFADGMTVITNVERLALKESDRIFSTLETLRAFGITASSDGHTIAIYGGKAKSATVDSFNDHRIVMAGAILACATGGKITNAEAINKSYPNFFEHLRSVGGNISEV